MQTNTCCVSSPTIHVHMHISMYTYRYTPSFCICIQMFSISYQDLHWGVSLMIFSFFLVFIFMVFFVLHFLLLAFSFHVDTTWEWAFAVYCVDRLPLTVRSRSFINKTRQGNTWKRWLSKLLEQHNKKTTKNNNRETKIPQKIKPNDNGYTIHVKKTCT